MVKVLLEHLLLTIKLLDVGDRFIILFLCCITLVSCRLDENMFDNEELFKYELDDYGAFEIQIADHYDIHDSLVNMVSLSSKLPTEALPTQLSAVYVGDANAIETDTVILYCHGNYGHLDYYWTRIKLLANIGHKNKYGVFAMDYRGYGMSGGEPTEEGIEQDVHTAMEWLEKRGLTTDRLIMYGYSLGSAPATELTANDGALQPSKLILEAPFANTETMIQDVTGLVIPGKYVTNITMNVAQKVTQVQEPLLWLHGDNDQFLNIQTHGEVVFASHPGEIDVEKFAVRVNKGEHSNLPKVMGTEYYLQVLENFIAN
jgi:alpha/beta superfamily hydrolase